MPNQHLVSSFRLVLAVAALGLLSGYSQLGPDPSSSVLEALRSWRDQAEPEKAYLATDKEAYLAGETIWMSGFVVDGVTHVPDARSALLYVDLVDSWGRALIGRALLLEAGRAAGQMELPADLPPGAYQLRVYTGRMRGYDEGFVFRRPLDVGNPGQVAYGPTYFMKDDSLIATLLLEQGGIGRLRSHKVDVSLHQNGRRLKRSTVHTDTSGTLRVAFAVSDDLWSNEEPEFALEWRAERNKHTSSFRVPPLGERVQVRFFPEGGEWVAGFPSLLGIHATLPDGRGVPVSGRILDGAGAEAARFETGDRGLGKVEMTPSANGTYTAVVDLPDGTELRALLPTVRSSGVLLRVGRSADGGIALNVLASPPRNDLLLVVHRRGELVYVANSADLREEFAAEIPKDRLGSGVLHITVFDGKAQALAERLWFNMDAKDVVEGAASMQDTVFRPRSKVRIPMAFQVEEGGRISLAGRVVDGGSLATESLDLRCWLLLASDLRGQPEKPCDLLLPGKEAEADLLMLTHGWRRFHWKQVIDGGVEPLPAHEDGFTLKGSVADARRGRGLPNSPVTVVVSDAMPVEVRTDRNGHFSVPGVLFPDSTRVIVNGDDLGGDRLLRFTLDPVHVPTQGSLFLPHPWPSSDHLPGRFVDAKERLAVDRAWGVELPAYTLDEVTVTDSRIRQEPVPSRLLVDPDKVIRVQELPWATGTNVLELLKRHSPGFRVTGSGRSTDIRNPNAKNLSELAGGLSAASSSRSNEEEHKPRCEIPCNNSGCHPLVLVDGIPVDMCGFIQMSIRAQDVEVIEFLNHGRAAIYGAVGFGGVISIVTRSGKAPERNNTYSQIMQGYTLGREFYAPDYGAPAELHRKPDLRTTLWWQPLLGVDADGRTAIEFWTGDRPGRYLVHAEGIDEKGRTVEFKEWIRVAGD